MPSLPATDETPTNAPLDAASASQLLRAHRNVPLRWISIRLPHSASVIVAAAPGAMMPAQATTASIRPKVRATSATAASTDSGDVTSAANAVAFPPSSWIRAATAVAPCSFTSVTATSQPAALNHSTVAAPRPLAPPTTSAVLRGESPMRSSAAGLFLGDHIDVRTNDNAEAIDDVEGERRKRQTGERVPGPERKVRRSGRLVQSAGVEDLRAHEEHLSFLLSASGRPYDPPRCDPDGGAYPARHRFGPVDLDGHSAVRGCGPARPRDVSGRRWLARKLAGLPERTGKGELRVPQGPAEDLPAPRQVRARVRPHEERHLALDFPD